MEVKKVKSLKSKSNKLFQKALFLIIILMLMLSGCEKSDADIAQIDELAAIVNKQIVKVEKEDFFDKSIDVDIDWLEEQLKESMLCERPSAIIALDLKVAISYEDGSMAVLRLLNPDRGIYSLRYDDKSYCLENDNLAQWLLKIANGENAGQ